MTSLPSKTTEVEPRRWQIRQMNTPSGHVSLTQTAGAGLPWHETVEVMPVSEHERLRTSMQQLYAYLWEGTPDNEDLLMMMLITSAALRGEQT